MSPVASLLLIPIVKEFIKSPNISQSYEGPFNNYVTLQGGGRGVPGVTLCDREGEGVMAA